MNRNNDANVRVPPNLTLVALMSCGLTIVMSIIYVTLCSLAIHARLHCNTGIATQSDSGSSFFINSLLKLYFKQDDCSHALVMSDITQEQTVFLLVCLTLTVSVVCLMMAVGFIAVLVMENCVKYIEPVGYCYVVMIFVSIANDLAAGIHFGIDFNTFTQLVDGSSPGMSLNYDRDMYRLGALLLIAVSLKGFITHIFNIVFISLIIVYLVQLRQQVQKEEASTVTLICYIPYTKWEHLKHLNVSTRKHRLWSRDDWRNNGRGDRGVLKQSQPRRIDEQSENSFQQFRQPKRNDDPWQNASESNYSPYRPQINPIFVNEEESPRILNREPPRLEYTSPSFDRSNSWHHNQPSLASRPFSYLEDNKRQAPLKSPSPNKEPQQWQRDPWEAQAPPVPAPDYSPETPRRLKSALKSSFM